MKTWEALKALGDGKKVRLKYWENGRYIYRTESGRILDDTGDVVYINLTSGIIDEEWEIYEETMTLRELLGYTIIFNGRKYYVVPYVLQRIHLNNEITTEVALMPLDQLSTPLTWIRLSLYHKIPINDILKTPTDNGIAILDGE